MACNFFKSCGWDSATDNATCFMRLWEVKTNKQALTIFRIVCTLYHLTCTLFLASMLCFQHHSYPKYYSKLCITQTVWLVILTSAVLQLNQICQNCCLRNKSVKARGFYASKVNSWQKAQKKANTQMTHIQVQSWKKKVSRLLKTH